MWTWFRQLFSHSTPVSQTNLRYYALQEMQAGVDLPTWRRPAEVAKMRRVERLRASKLRRVK